MSIRRQDSEARFRVSVWGHGENLVVHWECSMIMNLDPSGV